MRETSSQYFVGLDIGTSAVRCIVGTYDANTEDPVVSVVGYGSCDNSGLRKGLITHLDDVAGAIHEAVVEAERMSGIRVENATVNINGSHVSSVDSKGVIAISTASKQISHEDKMRVEEAAAILQLPSNREIIQVFPKNYQVDGHDSIKDPVGMQGVRLEVETHIITAATPNLRSLDMALQKNNIYPSHHTVSGLAAAEMVLSRKQREAGAAVVDIGASTTNLAVIEDGEIQHVAVIPMGGINITNDLAIGLKVDLEIAEKVKLEHATLDEPKASRVSVEHDKRNYVFEPEDVKMIVEARVEEIFEYVDKELKKVHRSQKLPGGVVLVGGSAKIPGIAELAKNQLQLPAKVGSIGDVSGLTDDIGDDLSFVTAVGLMHLDMIFAGQSFTQDVGGSKSVDVISSTFKGIWSKIKP